MDTLIQKTFFYTMKTNNFRGDLTDISATKEALITTVSGQLLLVWTSWAGELVSAFVVCFRCTCTLA